MRCRFCFQNISSALEKKYIMCSHCVHNYEQRPESMTLEEWLEQFRDLHEKQFSFLKNKDGIDTSTERITEIEDNV